MKKLLIVMSFVICSGCSSAPRKVLMQNCDPAGGKLFYCEEIPKKEIGNLK